jgi:hypothetical protein
MKFATILVTRSKSCHVKTLHTILKFNISCIRHGHKNEIIFVNDDPFEKSKTIQVCLDPLKYDRIFFVDFGIGVDDESINQVIQTHDGIGCLVFPGVEEGIDWEMFKRKVRDEEIMEPVNQIGLNFDTDVNKKISENIYSVSSTNAKCWVMFTKNIIKQIKDKKTGSIKIGAKMFEKFKEQGVKIHAFTASKLTMTYTHECISNILSAAGVKAN